jgi:dipeptidyl aminopeptidase/acylaminoacyl peptidase
MHALSRSALLNRWFVAALLILATRFAAAVSPPTAEVFGAMPHVSDVTLSPGGTLLAWIQVDAWAAQVVMYDLGAQKAKRVLPAGKGTKPRGLTWVDDDTLLMLVSGIFDVSDSARHRYELWRWVAVDASGGEMRQMLKGERYFDYVTGSELLQTRPAKPKSVYLSTVDFSESDYASGTGTRLRGQRKSGWARTVLEVDTTTGKATLIQRGNAYTTGWVLDGHDHVVARDEWYADRNQYRLLAADGAGWRELLTQSDGEQLMLVGASADAKSVFALGRRGASHTKVWSIPLDGSPPSVLAEDPDLDAVSARYDGSSAALLEVRFNGIDAPVKWLDKGMGSRFESASRAFPGRQVESYEESRDHTRALVDVGSPSRPLTSYVVDFAKHTAIIAGEEYPALAGVPLGEVSRIQYTARDGTSIPAFQTLPPASSGKNLPLVVLPHGGPNSHDAFGFNWLVQFLATRGYAVLQPQFRGSSGFGEAHERAGDHQWGGLMQDDVTDGVKALIDRGVADPRRICIVGASYGGYAALAGAAFTPDLYACAASIGGISDLPGLLAYVDKQAGEESDTHLFWRASIGSAHDANVVARSPARSAMTVRAPILLIHGLDDTVVPITQSELMDRALKLAGKNSVFVKLANEDHWLSRTETRVRVLKELESFLAANLGAAAH